MTNSIIFSTVILFLLTASSCVYETIRPDNEVTTRAISITDYSGIRVSDAFDVYITSSEMEEQISIEANHNIQDYIEVSKQGDFLDIGLKKHTRLRGKVTLNAHITASHLSNFEVSGASQVYLVNEFNSANVSIDLSGASGFSGEMFTEYLDLRGSGASTFDLQGTVGRLEGKVSGASTLRDFNLIIGDLDLKLTGASNAYLTVRDLIDYKGSGASTLFYKGSPQIGSSDVSGASRMLRRN